MLGKSPEKTNVEQTDERIIVMLAKDKAL